MTFKLTLAAAAFATLAGAAAQANPADQLAARAGVDAADYSLTEIVQLAALKSEDGSTVKSRTDHILNGAPGTGNSSFGEAQLAAKVGVEPGVFSLNELIELAALQNETGPSADRRRAVILAGAGLDVTRTAAGADVSAAKAQLAARAGVSPEGYTINDLVRLTELRRDSNVTSRVRFIENGGR